MQGMAAMKSADKQPTENLTGQGQVSNRLMQNGSCARGAPDSKGVSKQCLSAEGLHRSPNSILHEQLATDNSPFDDDDEDDALDDIDEEDVVDTLCCPDAAWQASLQLAICH